MLKELLKGTQMSKKNQPSTIEPITTSIITPHNKALYEAGKTLLIDSITTGREFCKFMISVSSGAIPIYLGLLKFVLPEHYSLSFKQGVLIIAPAFLFLFASVVFALGYYPQVGAFSLDIPQEIENERMKTIRKRRNLTWFGFIVFLAGNVWAIITVVSNLSTE